jgi:biotin operon repressor
MMHCSSLGDQMLTAYEKQRARGNMLMQQYEGEVAEGDLDDFVLVVRDRFLHGVHTAFLDEILRALKEELVTQQQMAEALGLGHRTNISKIIKSGTMSGVRLTAALNQYREIIHTPSREVCALYGFSRATSYIKAQAFDDAGIEGSMSPQDFSYLVGALASSEWDAAIRAPKPSEGRRVAAQIISERTIAAVGLAPKRRSRRRLRPEQYVLMLQELWMKWGDFAVIALWAIPDCIPEVKSGEATL